MEKRQDSHYFSPECEVVEIDVQSVLCTSGSLQDYNVEDFVWEGNGNE